MRLLPLVLLASCVINGGKHQRPRDLEESWSITKPRLLGVRSFPAEPRPGDTVTFEGLLVDPTDTIETVLWLACPTDGGGNGFGCTQDDDTELVGIEPFQAPSYTVPVDLLDGLSEQERREGAYILVQVTGLPAIDPAQLADFDFEDIDFNEVEAGYKRLVVSEATTPNSHPVLGAFTADGEPLAEGAVLEVDPSQEVEIGVQLDEDTIETYEYLNTDGELEVRTEQPYVTWYTDAGELEEAATLYPFLEATWVAPEESGDLTIWAVVRDRRGGQDWASLTLRVR